MDEVKGQSGGKNTVALATPNVPFKLALVYWNYSALLDLMQLMLVFFCWASSTTKWNQIRHCWVALELLVLWRTNGLPPQGPPLPELWCINSSHLIPVSHTAIMFNLLYPLVIWMAALKNGKAHGSLQLVQDTWGRHTWHSPVQHSLSCLGSLSRKHCSGNTWVPQWN